MIKEAPFQKGRFVVALLIALAIPLLPATAAAQLAGLSGITGVMRDTSGAVLPGVTVDVQTGRGESRAPCRRAVPASRVHRDDLPSPSRAVVRFYNEGCRRELPVKVWAKRGHKAREVRKHVRGAVTPAGIQVTWQSLRNAIQAAKNFNPRRSSWA